MHGPLSGPHVLGRHHERDVELRRPLRDGDDVDLGLGQRREHARRDAEVASHADPDHRHRRQPRARIDAVDLAPGDLIAELLGQPIARASRRPFGDRKADRLLGRRLGDERDADPLEVQRLEGPRRDPRHAQHAVPRDGEQRLPPHRRERLDRIAIERAAGGDLGARGGGIGERPDEHRDRAAGDGDERAGVQDLGAEVGQLGRLPNVQLRDHARVGDDPRVGGEQPRHVFPEADLPG